MMSQGKIVNQTELKGVQSLIDKAYFPKVTVQMHNVDGT